MPPENPFSDVPAPSAAPDRARERDRSPGLPTLGSPAPAIDANSTHGPLSLDCLQLEGKWVWLCSHPYDFTPVCSTELLALAEALPTLREMDVQPVGVSVDSVFAHIHWMRSLERDHGVPIDIPLIADLDRRVAQDYGMLHPGESDMATVRAVFVIDPKRIVRAIVYYPLNAGRSIDELIRITRALQHVDANPDIACPAGWTPGEKVILPPPPTAAAAAERVAAHAGRADAKDWYFVRRDA